MSKTLIQDCQLVDLSTISSDNLGKLTVIEGMARIPFNIKRVFYQHKIPDGQTRGSHAHKKLHQLLICIGGSFDVVVNDGISEKIIHLHDSIAALHIPPMIWASEINFAPNTVCLVLASDLYDESDYFRSYPEFVMAKSNARSIE